MHATIGRKKPPGPPVPSPVTDEVEARLILLGRLTMLAKRLACRRRSSRAIQVEPATIRRLFASEKSNPTIGKLAEVAAALRMRLTLEPLDDDERSQVTEPLLAGRTADTASLARHLHSLRNRSKVLA